MKTMLIHSNRGLGLVLTAAVLMTAPTLSGGTLTDDLDFDLEVLPRPMETPPPPSSVTA